MLRVQHFDANLDLDGSIAVPDLKFLGEKLARLKMNFDSRSAVFIVFVLEIL